MAVPLTLGRLRRMAVAATLREAPTIGRAVRALGFVQADPIRAPARAQDLILRHRVPGYRAGDLERRFPRLRLEEDFLYAYGIVPHDIWRLLHPRHDPDGADGRHAPSGLAADVLAFVREQGVAHPRDLEARFGRERALNGWGSWSKATTRALQQLQYFGLLRVARRQDGIRIYAPAPPHAAALTPEQRTARLLRLVVGILAPLPERSLAATAGLLRRGAPDLADVAATLRALLASGELASGEAEGERYLWPAGLRAPEAARELRFLAPFDPLVWDRRRFGMLWGWEYRFEAYTPPEQRRLGYYAMPMLWGDTAIGWVNVAQTGHRLQVEPGFAGKPQRDPGFRRAFDAELARLEDFLSAQ
jgi:uncharacterized protein YcaQ